MSDKPDWKDAPKWANWLAQDRDGFWCWFSDEPYLPISIDSWLWVDDSKYQIAGQSAAENWQESLEPRP